MGIGPSTASTAVQFSSIRPLLFPNDMNPEANKGDLMVDPQGAWWLGIYLCYAVIVGGAYTLYVLGTPVGEVALFILLALLVILAWSSL